MEASSIAMLLVLELELPGEDIDIKFRADRMPLASSRGGGGGRLLLVDLPPPYLLPRDPPLPPDDRVCVDCASLTRLARSDIIPDRAEPEFDMMCLLYCLIDV